MSKTTTTVNLENLSFSRRFLAVFCTQFLGALNDNLFKSALLIFAAFNYPQQSALYSNIIAALFILPFFIFSATAGKVSTKYNRRSLAIILKCTELILMLGVLFIYQTSNLWCLTVLLFLMGTQSTFYGPLKYAILPQLLNPKELIKGNAYTEGGTYLSIIIGSFLGTILPFNISCIILLIGALSGIFSASKIPSVTAPNPNEKITFNLWQDTKEILSFSRKNKVLNLTIWGITWFWMIGAFCLTEIFPLAASVFNTTPATVSFFLLLFSIGVGIGAFLSYKILKNKISLFYVPLASLAITLSGFMIFLFSVGVEPSSAQISLGEFLTSIRGLGLTLFFLTISVAGGIYVVPLNTLLQKACTPQKLAQVIAANNIINAFGMVVITIISALLVGLGCSIPVLFLALSIFNIFVAVYISKLYPKELIKSLFRLLLKALYRVQCENFEYINQAPSKTLVISNHTSLLDGILIAAFMPRNVCFAINTEWTKHPFIRFFDKVIDFYPIDTQNPLSIRNLINELNHGKTIMMFPEGRISVTGNLMKVFDGAGMIALSAHAKILPLRIAGADLSKFSYLNGLIKTRWFPKIRLQMCPPVEIELSEDKTQSKRQKIAVALFDIMRQMMTLTEKPQQTLWHDLKTALNRYGNKAILEDGSRQILTYRDIIKAVTRTAKNLEIEQNHFVRFTPENSLSQVIKLFACWKRGLTAVIGTDTPLPETTAHAIYFPNGESLSTKALQKRSISAYYEHGTNSRDNFFSELDLSTPENIIIGILLPLLSGAKLFLNNSHHGSGDLVYDTDSSVLCLNELSSLHRMSKSAGRLDFYAVRKVWLFNSAPLSAEDKEEWLHRFALRIRNF